MDNRNNTIRLSLQNAFWAGFFVVLGASLGLVALQTVRLVLNTLLIAWSVS